MSTLIHALEMSIMHISIYEMILIEESIEFIIWSVFCQLTNSMRTRSCQIKDHNEQSLENGWSWKLNVNNRNTEIINVHVCDTKIAIYKLKIITNSTRKCKQYTSLSTIQIYCVHTMALQHYYYSLVDMFLLKLNVLQLYPNGKKLNKYLQ